MLSRKAHKSQLSTMLASRTSTANKMRQRALPMVCLFVPAFTNFPTHHFGGCPHSISLALTAHRAFVFHTSRMHVGAGESRRCVCSAVVCAFAFRNMQRFAKRPAQLFSAFDTLQSDGLAGQAAERILNPCRLCAFLRAVRCVNWFQLTWILPCGM